MRRERPIRLDPSKDASSLAQATAVWDDYPSLQEARPAEALASWLAAAINRLPDDQQAVVRLLMAGTITIGGTARGWRDAGRELGVDHKTAQRRLALALATLEQELRTAPSWARQLLLSRVQLDDATPDGAVPDLPPFPEMLARLKAAA